MSENCEDDGGAPLATIDTEDWQEFSDYRPYASDGGHSRINGPPPLNGACENHRPDNINNYREHSLDNDTTHIQPPAHFHKPSIPDVNQVLKCFRSENHENTEILSQETLLRDSQVWHQVSETYNGAMPVDWNKSRSRRLQEHSLNLSDKPDTGRSVDTGDLSEDEDLQQAMDLHCLIVSSQDQPEEPVISAEQVISEIEEMMQESIYEESSRRTLDGPSKTAQLIRLKLREDVPLNASVNDCLAKLSVSDLSALVEELEYTITEYSEVLVQELALREELDFHKESNNQFISLLLSIQRKRRELEADKKKGIKQTPPKKQAAEEKSSSPSGTYLTTVIPYDHHEGIPDSDRLQIYIKIMTAINNDSPTVPSILTDYILKVLCPNT